MEEKKLDLNSIIGFVLIFGILIWMMYTNQPTPEELEAQEKEKQEQVEAEKKAKELENTAVTTAEDYSISSDMDSTQVASIKNRLGAFGFSTTLPSATVGEPIANSSVLQSLYPGTYQR